MLAWGLLHAVVEGQGVTRWSLIEVAGTAAYLVTAPPAPCLCRACAVPVPCCAISLGSSTHGEKH